MRENVQYIINTGVFTVAVRVFESVYDLASIFKGCKVCFIKGNLIVVQFHLVLGKDYFVLKCISLLRLNRLYSFFSLKAICM